MKNSTLLKTTMACAMTLGMASVATTAFAEMTPPQKTDAMMATRTIACRRVIPALVRIPKQMIPVLSSRCRQGCAPRSRAAA
jgi:hypothetical protein